MTHMLEKPSAASAGLMNGSMLLYLFWLLLPAVQTTGRAVTGVIAVAVFGAGALLDAAWLKAHGWRTLLRALCAAAMPLLLRAFLRRGGDNGLGFYAQQAMFWFPLVFAGYARERGDSRLRRWIAPLLLGVVAVTTLTTIGWLIQGMLRGGRVYAYSRSLGFAGEGEAQAAYLKELMLRNIGGYDFIYATVAALPLTCIAVQRSRGWGRAGFAALLTAQAAMVALSQYTYAMVYTAAILAVEGAALVIRALSHGRVKMGPSLLWGALPLAAAFLLRVPLISLAAQICERLGLSSFAFSFQQLLQALQGGAVSADSRLGYYLTALEGFGQSPLTGSMFGAEKLLSQHSDILDALSGMGLLGTALLGGMIWLMGRGALRGIQKSPDRAQLTLMGLTVAVTALLGTVVYSRDIPAICMMGLMLVLEADQGCACGRTSRTVSTPSATVKRTL